MRSNYSSRIRQIPEYQRVLAVLSLRCIVFSRKRVTIPLIHTMIIRNTFKNKYVSGGDMLNLSLVFFVIIVLIWMKKPLYIAIGGGLAAAILCFRVPPEDALRVIIEGAFSKETLSVVLGFYSITFLQRMLEKRNRLKQAQESLDDVFHNRRVNASLAPAVIGLLPSAGALLISGAMVKDSCGRYMSDEDMTFTTSFFRHIPECFLPTYSSILLALTLTGVSPSGFVLAMLPMVAVLFALGYFFMLRKIPKETDEVRGIKRGEALKLFGRSLWSIALIILIILLFDVPVYLAAPMGIAANFVIDRFSPKEILPIFGSAFEPVIIGNTILIMVFKNVLTYVGVIEQLPGVFSKLPLSPVVIFGLIFFVGTIVSGSQAIVALCLPMAMAAIPGAGLPLVILLMCTSYAAMQLSPTHICLFIAVEYFGTEMGALIKRTIPVIACFCVIMSAYYLLLNLLL